MRPTRVIIPVLPALLTLGNLFCGFLAMAKTIDALSGSMGSGPLDMSFGTKILHAVGFIFLAMVFDALDGRIARLTKQTSAFGAQLDSLADVVTFGVAPALLAKVVYEHTKIGLAQPFSAKIVTMLCAMYLIGAVLRLARFTVATDADAKSHDTFQGLPSPAAAGLVAAMCLFVFDGRQEVPWLPEAWADTVAITLLRGLPAVACLLGLLMVSRVPYVHVVQRYVGHRARATTIVNLVLVVWIVMVAYEWFLFVAMMVYVVGGLVLAIRARATGRHVLEPLPEPWAIHDDDHADKEPPPGPS